MDASEKGGVQITCLRPNGIDAAPVFRVLSASDTYAIDLGSQYMKVARSTLTGDAVMVQNSRLSILFPAAAAVKPRQPIALPLTSQNLKDIDLRFGDDALFVLKRKPDLGYPYLPRALARNESATEFGRPLLASSAALFSLMIQDLVSAVNPPAFGIVVPGFWTQKQISLVSGACRAFQLPLQGVIDDLTAMATLYSVKRGGRVSNHVLFVDVGATSVKAYSAVFTFENETVVANNTAYVWSERAGSYYFAKAISQEKNISLRKAQKQLTRSPLAGSLIEVSRVVAAAYQQAVTNGGPVGEVQVIGGSSSLPPVFDAIKKAVNGTTVRREFPAQEALARGGVLATLLKQDIVPFVPCVTVRRSLYSMNFTCNSTQVLCERGSFCPSELVETAGPCPRAAIVADPSQLPEGLANPIAGIELSNSSGHSTGCFRFDSPDPVLKSVRWCDNGTCVAARFSARYGETWERATSRFLMPWLELHDPEMLMQQSKSQIQTAGELVNRLDAMLGSGKDISVEATDGLTEEMFQAYQRYSRQFKSGEMQNWSPADLEKVIGQLRAIQRATYFH